MSELKTHFIDDTYVEYYNTGKHDLAQIYLKAEADKVIAELKDRLDTTEKLLNKSLNCISNDNKHIISLARKKNHADYKRCLAMAYKCVVLCNKAKDLYRWAEDENLEHYYNHKIEFFAKWHNRWLELAEKFKDKEA